MDRAELKEHTMTTYAADSEFPWLKYPSYEVFLHSNNRKRFALIMDVPKEKLGLQSAEMLSVVNFKCDPFLKGSLLLKEGFFPGYHMSQDTWITLALDGSVAPEEIKILLDMSFGLTSVKMKKRKTLTEL